MGPGEIRELAAFGPQETWPATVTAQGCDGVVHSPEKLWAVVNGPVPATGCCDEHVEVGSAGSASASGVSVHDPAGKIMPIALPISADGRKVFILPLKRDELADYLNVARPSLSRELARCEGLIDFTAACKLRTWRFWWAFSEMP